MLQVQCLAHGFPRVLGRGIGKERPKPDLPGLGLVGVENFARATPGEFRQQRLAIGGRGFGMGVEDRLLPRIEPVADRRDVDAAKALQIALHGVIGDQPAHAITRKSAT